MTTFSTEIQEIVKEALHLIVGNPPKDEEIEHVTSKDDSLTDRSDREIISMSFYHGHTPLGLTITTINGVIKKCDFNPTNETIKYFYE